MEAKEQEKLYTSAKTKIQILEVIMQPEDKAEACKEIASLLKSAGDYKDAKTLAAEYENEAKEFLIQAKQMTYDKALNILSKAKKVSDYDRGIKILKSISSFKDSKTLAEQYREKKLSYIKKNNFLLVIKGIVVVAVVIAAIFGINNWLNKKALEKDADSGKNDQMVLADKYAGDEVTFGNYKWKVIDKDADSLKLLAIHVDEHDELMNVSYHNEDGNVDWEHSSIRNWLNNEFITSGFSEEERALILSAEVVNDDNTVYETKGGAATQDYVYLPNETDVQDYWMYFKDMSLNCWLRTPGNSGNTAAYLSSDHKLMLYGLPANQNLAIRPIINVSFDVSEEKKPDLSENKIGDTVKFGIYKWKILDMDAETALLISVNTDKYPEFTAKTYHDEYTEIEWKDSEIREWLNGEFLQDNFTDSERERILVSDVTESVNGTYNTSTGAATQDQVYLLSTEEAQNYWSELNDFSLNWLLRTPGNMQKAVAYISNDHTIDEYGCAVTDEMYIRPVIRIKK